MDENLDIFNQESKYNLIWTKTTSGDDFNKAIVPANLLKHDRQYLLRIKTNLQDKSFKVIPFRTKEREIQKNISVRKVAFKSMTPPMINDDYQGVRRVFRYNLYYHYDYIDPKSRYYDFVLNRWFDAVTHSYSGRKWYPYGRARWADYYETLKPEFAKEITLPNGTSLQVYPVYDGETFAVPDDWVSPPSESAPWGDGQGNIRYAREAGRW